MIKNVHFNVDIYMGNAVEHMDQVLAEPEIPERSTEL